MILADAGLDQVKDLFEVYQQNINNNITWFLGYLTLSIAIAGGALLIWSKFLVQQSMKKELEKLDERIEKIVKKNHTVLSAHGTQNIPPNRLLEIYGLAHFKSNNLINLVIFNRDGSELQYLIKNTNDLGLAVTILGEIRDYEYVHWNVFWLKPMETTGL